MASGAGLLFLWSRRAKEELETKVRERTAELSAKEALLSNVLDTLPVGVWITDGDGAIIRGNPAGREIWGGARYVNIEQYGEYKGWWIETGKRIEAEEWALARALMKGETSLNEVIEIECFDESRKIILNSAAPVRDANGEIMSAIVVNEDITEKRLAETYTLAANALLNILNQSSSRKEYTDAAVEHIQRLSRCRYVGLRLVDERGAIPYESYVGFSREFWEQENRLFLAGTHCACTRVITGQFEPQDAPFLTPSGSFYCEDTLKLLSRLSEEEKTRFRGVCIKSGFASVAVIPLRHNNRALGAIHIADERKGMVPLRRVERIESLAALIAEGIVKFETREELHRYMARLEQSNRALEEFAYVASHDLQEPLRKIGTFGDRLGSRCGDLLGAEGQDYLRRMQSASSRMQDLIHALLEYSRATSKPRDLKEVPLRGIVDEVLADLEVRIEQTRAEVQVGELPTITADSHQMRQLFQNLIVNAIKYQPPDHRPVVKVQGAQCKNGSCRITVEDNGIGFEEKYLDKIFAPFQRLHGRTSQYEGTGMGLAICRRIVERHGGSITAESTPGKGSTFIIDLPRYQ
jgi:PAS domain S-box-containing protein